VAYYYLQGFIQAPLGETSPKLRFGQVYSSIKNPVIALIQCAAIIQVYA